MVVYGGAHCVSGPYDYHNDVYVFDPKNLKWTKKKTQGVKPTARAQHSAIIYGKRMFIIGFVLQFVM
jgi:N-acetylneuraminic acid mutarotase